MSNIDRRIVDMQFNNREFEKGAGDTISTLDKLKKALNFDKSTDGLESLKSKTSSINLEGITAAVESLSSRFSTLGIIGVTALTNITNRAVDASVALAKSLSVDQITTGFSKYEQKTANMQTLLNSTGKSVEEVNGYLNQLMWFSDETSYGFTDMTAALSQMTSAGGDIEKLVPLITGVANSVAFSGKGAAEFSRAMYNLNQSYSSGSLNLMDMKSLDLAGVSSKQLKEELIAAGEALGTIKKGSVNLGNFNDTLKEKWANREVMEKAFGSFAELSQAAFSAVEAGQYETASEAIEALSGNYSDLSVKAFTAAQTAKSFSEAIDATKDAVSSGWMRTIEILFGDFEESKVLWTAVTGELWEVFAAGAEDRNEMLQGWKDLGGREKLIHGFAQAWSNLKDIFGQVSEAFKYVFPPMTSEKLNEITNKFSELMEKLKPSEKLLETIKKAFSSFFGILDIGRRVVTEVLGLIVNKLTELAGPHMGKALDFISGLSDSILEFYNRVTSFDSVLNGLWRVISNDIINPFLSNFGTSVEDISSSIKNSGIVRYLGSLLDKFKEFKNFSSVSNVFNVLKDSVKSAIDVLSPYLTKFKNILGGAITYIKERLADLLGHGDISETNLDIVGLGSILLIFKGIGSVIDKIKGIFNKDLSFVDDLKGMLSNITGILDSVRGSIESYTQNIKAKTLVAISSAIAVLVGSIYILSTIDTKALAKATVALGVIMLELFGSSSLLNKIDTKSIMTKSAALVLFSTSILILSSAIKKLAAIDGEELGKGLLASGLLMTMVIASAKALGQVEGKLVSTSAGLVLFSAALKVLTSVVKKLGEIDAVSLAKGLGAVGVLIAELVILTKLSNFKSITLSSGLGFIAIATALKILTGVVKDFSELSVKELTKGMVAIAASLTILVGGLNFIKPSSIIAKASALVIASSALLVVQKVVKKFGEMPVETLAIGMITLAGALGIMAVGLNSMNNTLVGAAALVVATAAVNGLLIPLKVLGSMSLTEILTSLGMLAATFFVLAVAGGVLTPVIPALLGLSVALGLLSAAILVLGVGLTAVSIGLDMFAVSIAANSASFMIFMTTMLSLIPIAIQKIGEGIVLLIKVIGDSASEIVKSFMKIFTAIMDAIGEAIPKVVETFMKIITGILKAVDKALPDIIKMGFNILKNFMKGIRDNIQEVVTLGVDIVLEFVKGINKKMSAIVDTAFKTIITFINSLADAIRNNKQAIFDAVWNLITAIIEAIFSFASNLVAKGGEMIGSVVDGMAQGVSDFFSSIFDIGKDVVGGFLDGIKDLAGGILEAGGNMVSGAIQGASNFLGGIWNGIVNIGKSVGEAFTDGVDGKESDYKKSGKDAVDSTKSGIKTTVDDTKGYVKSQGSTLGSMFAEGMTAGIKAKSASLRKSAEVAAADAISAARRVYQIESPSKVGIGIGKNWILGNIKGNEMMAGKLSESSSEIAQDSIDAMKKTLATVVTQEDTQLFDMNPEITPFINLEKVKMGVEQLKDFFRNPNLVPAFSTQMAGNVSMANRYGRGYEDPRKQIDTKASNQYHIAENSTFYVREEADIRKISEQIAIEVERTRRG